MLSRRHDVFLSRKKCLTRYNGLSETAKTMATRRVKWQCV
jgi:hypothetical protein